jgi:hypothetical protein
MIDQIKERVDNFEKYGGGWRVTITNPYASSSTIMQEMGSYPEKVFREFLNNAKEDIKFLLRKVEELEIQTKLQELDTLIKDQDDA